MTAEVGQRAPEFRLPSTLGTVLALDEIRRKRIAVLSFVHFAFTGG